jgi:mannose-6-phosphate isomerase-like protein (cupin superfamily)
MRACRNASIVFFAFALPMIAFGACHDPERPSVPPVTSSAPSETPPSASETDASMAVAPAGAKSPVVARIVDTPATVPGGPPCTRVAIAAVRGPFTATAAARSPAPMRETLAAGDSVVWTNADAVELAGSGLAVVATYATAGMCPPTTAPPPIERVVVRASAAPKLDFAKGAMSVHLDVGAKVSPELYLGRLEGTAAVPEHDHPTSWEILAAVEASGTFVLDGIEKRLGPKQIVVVPPGTKHAWRPDAGSKLVAIQMYSPPGPEQRFVALAAAEKDAGKDAR